MSIVNVWVWPERAIVVADTEGRCPLFGVIEVSKMVPLVHANAILAVRGNGGPLGLLYGGLSRVPCNFDELVTMIPEVAPANVAHHEKQARDIGLTEAEMAEVRATDQIILVGWSEAARRMQGWRFDRWGAETKFQTFPINPWFVAPAADFDLSLPVPQSRDDLTRIARRQTTWHRQNLPGKAIGGRILSAEITQRGMTISELCEIDDERPA